MMKILSLSKKKGVIREIINKALYHDGLDNYIVSYRDFDKISKVSLKDFLKLSDNMQIIPVTRIVEIKKENEILFKKFTPKK